MENLYLYDIYNLQIEMEKLMEMLQAQVAAQQLSDSLDSTDAAAKLIGEYYRLLYYKRSYSTDQLFERPKTYVYL